MNKMRKVKGESPMMGHDMPAYLPSFSMTEKDLPEIKDWQVGKKYKLQIEVEMVSSSKNEYGKTGLEARFKIHKVGTKDMMSEKEMEGRKGRY
jgi:hypothetical protein